MVQGKWGVAVFLVVLSWVNISAYFKTTWRKWRAAGGTGLWIWTSSNFLCLQWISWLYKPDQIRTCQQRSNWKTSDFTVTTLILTESWSKPLKRSCNVLPAVPRCHRNVLKMRLTSQKIWTSKSVWPWYDPESFFHQGWNGLGSNWQKLGFFFPLSRSDSLWCM